MVVLVVVGGLVLFDWVLFGLILIVVVWLLC